MRAAGWSVRAVGAAVAGVAAIVAAIVWTGDGRSALDDSAEFQLVTDDSGRLGVEVPASWDDVSGAALRLSGGVRHPYVQAAPDLVAYHGTLEAAGLELILFTGESRERIPELLAELGKRTRAARECDDPERRVYARPEFRGVLDVYAACRDQGGELWLLAGTFGDVEAVVILGVQGASGPVRQRILETFEVTEDGEREP